MPKFDGCLFDVMKVMEECTSDGWWDWHIKDNYKYMSERFWEMLGYNKEKDNMLDQPSVWKEKVHPDDIKTAQKNFEKHIQTKGEHVFYQELRCTHKKGHTVWVICKGKVIEWDDDGSPVRMVGVHIDITKLKNTEEALSNKIKELEDRDKTLRSLRDLLEISNKVKKKAKTRRK